MDFLEMMSFTERDFSAGERKKAADSGSAMKDGSFPIQNEEDLHNAVQAIGRASNPAAAKAHIKTRAKALGCEGALPDDWKESAERCIFANVEQLEEAATTYQTSTGNLTITVIKPGWSKNNRYYPASLLKSRANIFEGAKMFTDHATEKEASARPEGSVRDWVGTITGVKTESDGVIKATANIHHEAFKTNLSNLKKAGNLSQMGISIRAIGECSKGEAEGRKGAIVESILGCKSVDFVTFAAAGGQVESMSEAVDPDDVMLMGVDTLRAKRPDLVKAIEAKPKGTTLTEAEKAQRTFKKHNGADTKFVEGSPFNDEHTITETNNTNRDPYAKMDGVLHEALHLSGNISAAELKQLRGDKPEAYDTLNETQKRDYDFARAIGLNESDALKVSTL